MLPSSSDPTLSNITFDALEETYYHRLNPPQGFGFQRVYTDDRSLDEAMAIEDGDVVRLYWATYPFTRTPEIFGARAGQPGRSLQK